MTEYIDNLKRLAGDNQPHYFGLGFIQLKINEHDRVHFYSRDLDPILDEEEIHDHRYGFVSKVHKGTLRNRLFYFNAVEESDWELAEVSCTPNDSREPTILLPNVNKVELAEFDVSDGQSYTLTSQAFHQVLPITRYVITRLTRGYVETEFARVIRNKKNPYVCPFSAPISVDRCWELIEEIATGEQ